jgi:hypothetical protein
MPITTLLDPTKMPNQSQDQATFDSFWAALLATLPTWSGEVNATAAAINALAAGGAYAIPFTFDTTTADADPGTGKLRLDNVTQTSATTMRLDLLSAASQDVTAIIDRFDASTSTVKGSIRLVKQGDATKWLTFDITARAAPTGYRNITVTNAVGSSASPFANGDGLMLLFQRNGDIGPAGTIVKRTYTVANDTAPTTNTALYDMHIITALQGSMVIGAPTGTPSEGQGLIYRIKDNGVSRTIAYNAIFRAPTELAFPSATVVGKWTYLGFVYNATDSKWDLLSAVSNM